MTARKHFKQLVRERMGKTGESYATARRQILQKNQPPSSKSAVPWHYPGNIPATTALRVLLAHAGIVDPATRKPFTESMLFGLAGGLGIGVFSFFYEKEDFASFFIAGRHLWHDDSAYFQQVCKRFTLKPVVSESSTAKAAEKNLRAALAQHGPCIAWVDAAHLPHRAMPAQWSGGAYHVITVYSIDDATGQALIGDLTDEPISIALGDLAEARGRIKKFKSRLLSIPAAQPSLDFRTAVREALQACHRGLTGEGGVKSAKNNFSLEALRVWGERMHGSRDKESWERVFAPGARLWRVLVSSHDFIEYYGTGGGLCRPLFAEFLGEAGRRLNSAALLQLGNQYEELGRQWTALAEATLPRGVPPFQEARALLTRRTELVNSGGRTEELRAVWSRLDEVEKQVRERFPLTAAECDQLRAELKPRILALYEGEKAAHQALGQIAL
jgi:hypothetical protein